MRLSVLSSLAFALAILAACETADIEDEQPAQAILEPVSWQALPGWQRDAVIEARPAMALSCNRLQRVDPANRLGPDGIGGAITDWQRACTNVLNARPDQFRAARSKQASQPIASWMKPAMLSGCSRAIMRRH
ncbi:MAG: hypothetical protein AAF213_14045 [Pseudomonadota bacterium]